MHARTWMLSVVALLSVTSLTGCASEKIDRLQTDLRRSQEQLASLRAQLQERDERLRALLEAGPVTDPAQAAEIERLKTERDAMRAALDQAEARIRNLGQIAPVVTAALPQELDEALVALAKANPELLEYDAKRGMVKFRSDFTFGLGSTAVKTEAARTLASLAGIVNLPAAGRYEVVIVGHTDNVPIKRVKAQHPTNWHLSVHRAIAVKDVLGKAGVNAGRMAVKGYGEYRPIVANGARGAEANRRVEIFLVPATKGAASASPAAPAPAAAAPKKPEDLARFK